MTARATDLERVMARAANAFGAGDVDQAARCCAEILREAPTHFYALHLASVLALKRGDWSDAVELATRALVSQPAHPEVLANRGAALRQLGRHAEAIADYDAVLARHPESPDARNNRGVALAALDRHEEALAEYARAVRARPGYAEAFHNMGVSLAALNRHEEAIAACSRVLALDSMHARSRWNRGLSRLALGDLAGGFADYEARFELPDRRAATRTSGAARWSGREPLAGRSILLLAEQGLGDTLMFQRFARVLHERGARVTLEAPEPLAPLLEPLPYLDRVISTRKDLPACDFESPLASLPALLGTTPETLPAQEPPLAAPRAWIERWSERLAHVPRPRIALAWAGGTGVAHDPRTIPLEHWRALTDLPAHFVSLQKDVPPRDEALLEAMPIAHFADAIHDFRDTAALVSLADATVTIDTASAHLAGAMGAAPWILLPFAADWRWGVQGERTPWYPHATLVRRARGGGWDDAIARVRSALAAFLERARAGGNGFAARELRA